MQKAGFNRYDIDIRQVTPHVETLDPLIQIGSEMCDLSELPRATQDKIRETTIEMFEPYKTDKGYEFPDRVVVGTATK